MTPDSSPPDPFLHRLYDLRGDSPMQRRLRRLCPLPVGVVPIQQADMDEAALREMLRIIHAVGFRNLKQFHFMGRTPVSLSAAEQIALEENIIPYWYGIGGWAEITPDLCRALGLPDNLSPAQVQAHPAMIAHQTNVLKERARRRADKGSPPETAGGMGEPSRLPCAIPPGQTEAFVAWLQREYGSLDACRFAYKMPQADPAGQSWEAIAAPFVQAAGAAAPDRGWADFRRVRDVLRFQADRHFVGIREMAAWHRAWDPDEPVRAGCHLVFENQAISGWDFEGQAQAIKEHGSFYASFHPAHHLTEVGGELDIPCYLTARLVADFAKGGWPALWESVGGPSQYSGTYPRGLDGNTLTRCLLSYLAAGIKGIGLWSWNVRDWGWEIGEYALTDLTGKPTDRAFAAAAVARACDKWRWELWEAHDEPVVGILYSWENEAAFARLSMGGYVAGRMKGYPLRPSEARIGAARALIHGNIPFEFVTERDLAAGLAPRYRTIYVPHTLCLTRETLRLLRTYVENGGHLVIDAPTLLVCADDGTRFDTRAGSDFERLFGVEHADMQDTFRTPVYWQGNVINGQTFDVNVTTAHVHAFYDGTDRPACLHHLCGHGQTTVLTWEVSRLCHVPGNVPMERLIQQVVLRNRGVAPWQVDAAEVLTYRRVAPAADHYFFVNPTAEAQTARLVVRDRFGDGYHAGEDGVTGEILPTRADGAEVPIPAGGARWIRLQRGTPPLR